ncbi:oligopeptide/dipeptide ABC transporter ATP-binding protein [Microvirga sp. 2YAF29]|uniref:oligopeptide/dipeptide ABC transporter ATP-binding protein n=1 Tax=Microvirga sp. 2YAF29 TaxID=3233031 RepID=UPI003F9689A4
MNGRQRAIGMPPQETALLSIQGITKVYGRASMFGGNSKAIAVRGVDLNLKRGQTLGIVGESGCGKSTLSRIISGITPPTSGNVYLEGEPVIDGSTREQRKRLRDVQMVFQSPAGSLDPRMRIGAIVAEPLDIHRTDLSSAEKRRLVSEIMARVGLNDSFLERYPHQLSGGQQQRVGIARALITNPKVVICDEAVSALDVSVQAQIINLLLDIQKDSGVSYIFISHDLSVVASIADEIAVMYMGQIVEEGPANTILSDPAHPYTKVLIESAFVPDPRIEKNRVRAAAVEAAPGTTQPSEGCLYRPRCRHAIAPCEMITPDLLSVGPEGRVAACHNEQSSGASQAIASGR